jgi:hypothetical protein
MCQAGCHPRTIAADAPVNDIALIKALTSYIQHEDRDVGTVSLCVLASTHHELLPLGKPELPKLPVSVSDAQKMTPLCLLDLGPSLNFSILLMSVG